MRVMVLVKASKDSEAGVMPSEAQFAEMGKFNEELVKAGVILAGEGLHPSSKGTRIQFSGKKRTVVDGPFSETKELVAGFALMRVRSKQEAISWCDRFAAVVGDVELYMGPVVEPWDLGMVPKPKNPPQRYLAMHRLDERSENDAAPDPKLVAEMGALIAEMTSAGVLLATGGLSGTRHGARIRYDGGKRNVLDGPFAESKELVAGYAIIDVPSKAAAIEWALRFGEVVKVNEIEVRQVCEEP